MPERANGGEHNGHAPNGEAGPDDVDSIGGNGNSCGFAKDGYRVEVHWGDDLLPELKLYLTLFVAQAVYRRWLIGEWENTLENRGQMLREQVFWEAVAIYLNSGGDITNTAHQLRELSLGAVGGEEALESVDIADDYVLISTGHVWFTDEHTARQRVEHVFGNPRTQDAVHWIEDVLLETTTMQALAEEDGGDPFDDT